jgi:hypothetical protein
VDCQAGPLDDLEQPLENRKDYSPTESAEAAPVETAQATETAEIAEVPSAMRQVAKYFLHETGRTSLTVSELVPIRELERLHFPTRVNQEIDVAVARFRRTGRDPTDLTMDYLYESLKHQPGRKQKQRAAPDEKKREADERQENIEWERRQQEEIAKMFGGVPE